MVNNTGTLKRGLKIGEIVHKEFVLRPDVTAGDYFAAEESVGARNTLRFSAALVARQLVSIGEFKGPFSADLLAKLTPDDLGILIAKRDELELAGNVESPDEQTSSPAKP